jgi:hypothetical protein
LNICPFAWQQCDPWLCAKIAQRYAFASLLLPTSRIVLGDCALSSCIITNTHPRYNTHWRNWAEWCLKKSPPVNPLAHNPPTTPTSGIIEVKIFGSTKRSAMWGYFSVGSSLSRLTITIKTYFTRIILQVSTTCQTCDAKHNAASV